MSDLVTASKSARETLARALAALQSDSGIPPQLAAIAEPVSSAMGALFEIERSRGGSLPTSGPIALESVRRALALLQQEPSSHPAVQTALEAVAGSLSLVHSLSAPPARPAVSPTATAAQPRNPSVSSPATPPREAQANDAVGLPKQPGAGGFQPQPATSAFGGHAPGSQQAGQAMPAAAFPGQPAPTGAFLGAAAAAAQGLPQGIAGAPPLPQGGPFAPHPPGIQVPPSQPMPANAPASFHGLGMPPTAYSAQESPPMLHNPPAPPPRVVAPGQHAPPAVPCAVPQPAPGLPPGQPMQHAVPPLPAFMPVSPVGGPAAEGSRAPAPVAPPPELSPAQGRPGQPAAGGMVRVEAALGAQSESNFYKGLGGSDVIEHGGIFVSTYRVPPVGTSVALHIALPGGYEFDAIGIVRWVREPNDGEKSGFGAQLVQLTAEARQLVYRYVRNREPLFHDDM